MMRFVITIMSLVLTLPIVSAQSADNSVKAERNLIKDGNKAFNAGNFQKALDYYNSALDVMPTSEVALFNKAVTLTRLSAAEDSTLMAQAQKLYQGLSTGAIDTSIKEKANYNLGNMAFNAQDYPKSIEYYKRVLRSNPANTRARENLRVAQLKLPPEDENQDDQDQDQQQDQQDQQQNQQQQQQQQPQPQQGNSEQILQSMQNRENQTRKDTEKKEMNVNAASTDKPW